MKSVTADEDISVKYLKVIDLFAKEGNHIKPFIDANMALGFMFFRFDSRKRLNTIMGN